MCTIEAKVKEAANGRHEVLVAIPTLKLNFKLQKSDGCTQFSTRSSATKAMNTLMEKFATSQTVAAAKATPVSKAAKRSSS